MSKKPTAKSAKQEREIPIIWDFSEDLVTGYATNMLVQVGEHELFVSFFETPPPLLLNPKDVETLESVRAECIARIVILPERVPKFIEVLQKQLDILNANKKAAAKTNGSK
jgi:hypothetical protein